MTQHLRFVGMPDETARAFQSGALDANGQSPERHVSDGVGMPCRHCLGNIAAGDDYLILAYRPFPAPQPYAEVGPIFLHAGPCSRRSAEEDLPPMLASDRYLLRGYGKDDRIVYGSGRIVPTGEIKEVAGDMLQRPDIAYVHVRSASNNCYQCRIELGS